MEERTVFATGFTLEDVREAIRDTDEFKVSVYQDEKDGSELLFFNYRFCTHATFPSLDAAKSPRERLLFQLKRECRGLAFRVPKQGEAVVAGRMLHKFFNVEEREETQLDLISLGRPHTLAVKYDGSLVAPIFFNGRVQFATKSGFSEVAKQIEDRFGDAGRYAEWSAGWIASGHTPLFEWCSPRNKILLDYAQDQLILLGIRNNASGRYMTHRELHRVAKEGNIAVAELMEAGDIRSSEDLVKAIKSREEVEGFVILFEDTSEMYKVKTDWYFARANQKKSSEFSTSTERGIWNLCLTQQVDDAAAFMDPVRRRAVQVFCDKLFAGVAELARRVVALCNQHAASSKRDFVKACQQQDAATYPQSLCFAVFDRMKEGGDPFETVSEWAIRNTGTVKGLEQLRGALGGAIRFSERVEPEASV